jgi:hypothetical protein
MREQRFEEFLLGPQAHAKERAGELLLHVRFESTHATNNPSCAPNFEMAPKGLSTVGRIDWPSLRLHLDTKPRRAEAKWPGASEDVYTSIGALWTAVSRVALRSQNSLNQQHQRCEAPSRRSK